MKLPSKKRIIIEISLVIVWFVLRFTLENYYDFKIPIYTYREIRPNLHTHAVFAK